jgi:hypothetical protein
MLGVGNAGVRRKEHPHTEIFAERDLEFGGAGSQEINRQAAENSRAVTTGAVGVDSTAMRKAFEGLQGKLEDFVGGRSGKARDETCTTGIVVRVPPVRLAPPATHSRVIEADRGEVQCRIFMECIRNAGAQGLASALELRNFAEVKFPDFHWGNDHFEGFLGGSAARGPEGFDIHQHL